MNKKDINFIAENIIHEVMGNRIVRSLKSLGKRTYKVGDTFIVSRPAKLRLWENNMSPIVHDERFILTEINAGEAVLWKQR